MTVTAQTLADSFPNEILAVVGDPAREARSARPLSSCTPGSVTYLKAGGDPEKFRAQLQGVVLVCTQDHARLLNDGSLTCLAVENPRLTFMRIVSSHFSLPRPPAGVHRTAFVEPDAKIDPTATVSAHCYVGSGCVIGPRTILHPNVVLYSDVRIGADVVIHASTVVGADGFGYERNEDGALEKFPHIGGVVIEDDVEIGSNTSIDRGTLGDTIIRSGVRIDNQCHISHNVEIGRNSAVIAQSMIGGSVIIGDQAWLAPAALVLNQIRIGAGATVGLGAVAVKNVNPGETVMGSPAVPSAEFRATRAAMKALLEKK